MLTSFARVWEVKAAMALSGSSKKLGDAIRKALKKLGITPDKKIPDQAHHLLASSVVIALDTEFYKECKKRKVKPARRFADAAKYQLNGEPNGLLLPIRFGHQKHLNKVRHRGRHGPPYFKEIDTLLRPLYEDVIDNGKDVCGPDKLAFLQDFATKEKNVKRRITPGSTGNPSLYLYEKWSEKLWTKDYRDEGATKGKLLSKRGIVDDAAAGLEWEQNMKPIKRRHTLEGKKKTPKLNEEWYKSKKYPVPTDENT